jgi:hypothetical protein
MPEDSTWGPVIGQNTVTGHGVLPLTPLKYIIGHTFPNLLSCVTLKVLLNLQYRRGIYLSFQSAVKIDMYAKKTGCSMNAGFFILKQTILEPDADTQIAAKAAGWKVYVGNNIKT